MNISHKNKVIWWAPEESGEKTMSEILKNYDFLVINDKNDNVILSGSNYDHFVTKSEEFPDYKVICTVKNPYRRVFSLFLRFNLNNSIVKKSDLLTLNEQFNEFIDKIIISDKLRVKVLVLLDKEYPEMMYLKKWVFDDKIPDYFVREECFDEDIKNINFITDFEVKKHKLNDDSYDYKTMYDLKSAKKVYHLYKKHFYLCDYNPFSFTHNELTKDEKISFLHDTL